MGHVRLTAARITEEAADLADTVGFDKVTMSAVARAFQVADASLYSHVTDLHDLRVRVAVLAARDLADCVLPEAVGRSRGDALAAFADAYRAFALTHPGRYAATQMPLDPAIFLASEGHVRVTKASYAVVRGYGLAEPDLTDAVRLVRSTIHGFVSLEAGGGFAHSRDLATSWRGAIIALDRALRSWPADVQTDVEGTPER
jgi:AcrR family transcriptional regulator